MNFKTITVIGATGTMGSNVAGIFASFGNAKVYCVGRDKEKVMKIIPKIAAGVRSDIIQENLIPADFSELEKCVSESDLIFESLSEDYQIKNEIAKIVGSNMKASSISCTGTSGLSINKLALNYPSELRDRFFGVHMFNPPYNMSLCELISTNHVNEAVKIELREYLEKQLLRTVVEVEDAPAFLGNRIGFEFINEALIFAKRYKESGGIDYIDSILGPFTGRMMPPIATADFVGLDVHKAIVDNIYNNSNDFAHEMFVLPDFVNELVDKNFLGKKVACGFYKTVHFDNGSKKRFVYDIKSGEYRETIPYAFPFVQKMKKEISNGDYNKALSCLVENNSVEAKICLHFLLKYIIYSVYTAHQISTDIYSCDDVMATGFNWCPPIAIYFALSQVTDIMKLIDKNLMFESDFDLDEIKQLLSTLEKSKYDYRRYFRSGR